MGPTMDKPLECLRRFVSDRHGNFAMMMGFAAVPLLLAAGMSVDLMRIMEVKSRLTSAADAAVLSSLAYDSPAMTHAVSMPGPGPINPGRKAAMEFFKANLYDIPEAMISDLDVETVRSEKEIRSTISYTVNVKTAFGGLLNYDEWPVIGESTAAVGIEAAVDFYLLLDNTPSMGVGATPSDITKMVANTPDKCAFACHNLDSANNYYNLAKKLGVAMRIDVVRQATQKLTETAKDVRTYAGQYRMAVYTFGKDATALGLRKVATLSKDMDGVRDKSAAVDLMTIPYQNYDNDQQTSFDKTLADINGFIANPGSGIGSQPPQKVLFFVSDGVGDSYKPTTCTKQTTGGRCQEPIDTRMCKTIKDRGIKVAVLYTTYLPLPTNAWYNSWIKPFQGEISQKMKECASPGLFFEVAPSQGIAEAMDALFRKTISTLRLVS